MRHTAIVCNTTQLLKSRGVVYFVPQNAEKCPMRGKILLQRVSVPLDRKGEFSDC
jgi:hypothetical protein